MWGGGACLTLTVPSDEALMMWWPSGVKVASFTKEEWPRNSFRVFPDFNPWILRSKKQRRVKNKDIKATGISFLTNELKKKSKRSPDGLVEGGAEELAAVFTEADTGDSFAVGALEPPQTLTALDLPHLDRAELPLAPLRITHP